MKKVIAFLLAIIILILSIGDFAMSERNYWVLCDDNCKFEAMTKQQIIAAIAEATGATPTQIDDAFITKIKEQNGNKPLKFWIGTQAEYNAITTPDPNTFYIFTDSDELSTIEQIAEDTAEEKATELINAEKARNGVVLYEGTIETGTAVTIPNLLNYTLVKVTVGGCGNILCTVENDGSTTRIKGVGNGLLNDNTTAYIASVLLKGNANVIDTNKSCVYTNNGGIVSAPSAATVTKIIGIM